MKLLPLAGTPAQIEYAEKIRLAAIPVLQRGINESEAPVFASVAQRSLDALLSETSAKSIIENRLWKSAFFKK